MPVTLGPAQNWIQARVRFGYGENGNPASFYCTTRQENCSTTTNSSMPFAYESEGPVWQSCSAGCTIQVPALPGPGLVLRRRPEEQYERKGPVRRAASQSESLIGIGFSEKSVGLARKARWRGNKFPAGYWRTRQKK